MCTLTVCVQPLDHPISVLVALLHCAPWPVPICFPTTLQVSFVLTDSFTWLLAVALCPREYSQPQTMSSLHTRCQLRRPPAQGQQLPYPSCPAIVPSRRAQAIASYVSRPKWSRPEPSHAVPSRPVSCVAPRITLWRTDRAVYIPYHTCHHHAPRTLASLTVTPHHRTSLHRAPYRASRAVAPRIVQPGPLHPM